MHERSIYDHIRECCLLLSHGDSLLLRPFHLTIQQYETLRLLDLEQGKRMGDLVQLILCDNSKMTRIVDYLERSGWAERRHDPDDRRAARVFATSAGVQIAAAANEAHAALLRARFSVFDDSQQAQLADLMQTFCLHLVQVNNAE